MSEILDHVLANQSVFIGVLGVALIAIAAVTWLTATLNDFYAAERNEAGDVLDPTERRRLRIERVPLRMLAKHSHFSVPILFLVATAVSLWLIAPTEPIPKDIGLKFNELDAIALPPIQPPLENNPRSLIIFLHGWNGDPKDTWREFPRLVRSDPAFVNHQVVELAYPTYMLRRNLRASQLSGVLANELESRRIAGFREVSFVAHSMGGLLARDIVLQHHAREYPVRYKYIVSIASPYDGANVGALAAALGISRDLTRDVSPEAGYLVGLRQYWNQLQRRPETYCITSPHDEVVDQRSATSQCDREFRHLKWSHSELVKPVDRGDRRYSEAVRLLQRQ
jgi:pimeloyl-ACP methyl ester carboxylesterase